ncbi:RNA polymerase sigma factor [Nocardiopsis composta]
MERFDSGEPFVDPAVEGLERSLIARAFLSLRPDWQSVLWYTEIEGIKPAEAAGILGRDPNTVAALAYRAREGCAAPTCRCTWPAGRRRRAAARRWSCSAATSAAGWPSATPRWSTSTWTGARSAARSTPS